MRITAVTTACVEANFLWTFVRVHTDEGVVGTGECFMAPGLTATIRDLGQVMIGQNPMRIDAAVTRLRRATSNAFSGLTYSAISGIESALWDLKGRALGLPVYELLGGKVRDDVRVYVDAHGGHTLEALNSVFIRRRPSWEHGASTGKKTFYWDGDDAEAPGYTPSDYAARARAMVAEGYDAMKFDIDVPGVGADATNFRVRHRDVEHVGDLIAAVRDAVGPDVDIAVDGHWRWGFDDALRFAKVFEPLDLWWFEDPLAPPSWPTDLARLQARTTTPLCHGENRITREEFLPLLEARAVSILSPDFQKLGGVLEAKRLFDLADLFGVNIAPHNIGSPYAIMITAHIAATSRNYLAQEFHGHDVPFWDEMLEPAEPVIVDGRVTLPERPGFGVELNLETVRKYSVPGEPVFDG